MAGAIVGVLTQSAGPPRLSQRQGVIIACSFAAYKESNTQLCHSYANCLQKELPQRGQGYEAPPVAIPVRIQVAQGARRTIVYPPAQDEHLRAQEGPAGVTYHGDPGIF